VGEDGEGKVKRQQKPLDQREVYIIAKALTIAVAVLNHERPYRQESDIKDMNKLLKLTGLPPSALFERELNMVEDAGEALEQASSKGWANGVRRFRSRKVVKLFQSFPEDETS
jgi:hypothetical protein